VSGAWVQVELVTQGPNGPRYRLRANTTTGQDGVFVAAGLDPGTYQVRAEGSGHARVLSEPFEVADGSTADVGTLRVDTGVALQGRVLDDAGAPVEDATIALKDEAGRPVYLFSLVTTGSDGRYAVAGLTPGVYVVQAEIKGYAPAARQVVVTEVGARADLVLARGGTAEVLVQDEEGQPVAGARVVLVDEAGEPVLRTLSLVNLFEGNLSRTDGNGMVRIPDLGAGRYTVGARRRGWDLAGSPPTVRVEPGTTASATVLLRPEP
jgi:protocatechuate 3,4-dioxygenase beta subunit